MRAFLAVDLHDTLGPVAHAWGQAVAHALGPRQSSSLTWVAASRVHVTLRFFGELSPQRVDAVVSRLTQDPARHDAFDLAIGGAGTFPAHGRPRVLWLGFSRGQADLVAVHGWARDSLAGVEDDDPRERFSPHLTMARVRRGTTPGLGAALRQAAARTPAPHGVARVERITLMESVLSPKGPTYRPLAEFPLAAAGPSSG
jgi:RNA 2',3'-cyclic 3'-phosphodiesterase